MAWFYNLQSILFEFLEKGGGVVLLIAFLILIMWFFIFERIWYFQFIHPSIERDTIQEWSNVKKHKSWEGHMIRVMLISKAEQQIKNNIEFWDQDVLNSYFDGEYLETVSYTHLTLPTTVQV